MKKTLLSLALAISFGLGAATAHAKDVLVVLSSSDHLELKDGKIYKTGFYLNELMQPVQALQKAGHKLTFVTPDGRAPSFDRASIDKAYFGGDQTAVVEAQRQLDHLGLLSPDTSPVVSLARVEQIGLDQFDAVYVPGGHAPMQDLLHDQRLGRVLNHFHKTGKPTALDCHGPIALLSSLKDPEVFTSGLVTGERVASSQDWIYSGYKMTAFSNREEEMAKSMFGGEMKFYPQDALVRAGGTYSQASDAFAPHVVIDRELITGQNPASALMVAKELLKRLK
ncbi:type 1 glutamine amidotransferase domain-containing protein [Rhizobium sp. XQZ8]|uniref:type 1 glutamine amidotransferase domain-containing protein n=1 Tax=Rhizobium populisoli TaxID=2859785 RepID=UPI001C66ECAE|nr:type 1 glutamine amidotransferase domain-containing protein [Rhizobium populisoli]MBW6420824.1 type 1 glutamine amidotransferase domain-containing protein [Rhizobium populisoli]